MSFDITGRGNFEQLYAAPTATPTATIGDVMEDEMGGRWRYCRAGAAITNPLMPAGNYSQPSDCSVTATAVGSFTIPCTSLTVYDTVAANQFANGVIIIGAAAANRRWYHIRSNPAATTDDVTITLYHPVRYAIAGTEWATLTASPYYDVRPFGSGTSGFMSAVCMPMQPVTSGYYFWGKTRGPIFGVVSSTVPGAAANHRLCVFQAGDGALVMAHEKWASTSEQIAGYLIPHTGDTYAAGDQTLMLQLE